jgi:hypothetical protein
MEKCDRGFECGLIHAGNELQAKARIWGRSRIERASESGPSPLARSRRESRQIQGCDSIEISKDDRMDDRRPTLADMIHSQAGSGNASAGKRRLSMAEMLRQSPLMGNTVALPDAVESAQLAKARKEEAEQESSAPIEMPIAAPPQIAPVAEIEPATETEPRTIPNRYNLYARVQGRWTWQCDIHASSHIDGMRQAIAWLKPEHNAFPIRLEQDELSAA